MKATPKKKPSKAARIWIGIGTALVALIAVLAILITLLWSLWLGPLFNNLFKKDDENYDPNVDIGDEGTETIDPDAYANATDVSQIPLRGNEDGVRNILLLGIDGDSYSGRSDTTMILSINDKAKTIKLVSLQRDTWVTIPGRDKDGDGKDDIGKLNAAYAYGRHPLQRKMIQQNFRLDIDDYISVNFETLPKVIDALGGLDIKLTAAEMTQIPDHGCNTAIPTPGKDCDGQMGFVALKGEPGVHHLNGFQAMQYARIRKLDSDFKRTARQREVVTLMLEKAKSMNYAQLASVITKALGCVETNMEPAEFLGFAASAMEYMDYEIKTDYSVPQTGEYKGDTINGGAGLLLTDPKATVEKLHQYLYG